MKHLVIISILVFTVTISSAQESKKKSRQQKKAEKEQFLIEQTKELIESKTWEFDANHMLPSEGNSKNIATDNYSVVFENNKVYSSLPFYGRAYSISYGSAESPMRFESNTENYNVKEGKNESYIVKFSAKNKSDKIDFSFYVGATGSATLNVISTNRAHITYYGDIIPLEADK